MSTNYNNSRFRIFAVSSAFALLVVMNTAVAGGSLKKGAEVPEVVRGALADKAPESNGKLILLDFWASWCGPCKKSFPVLEKLYQEYKDRGFVVVGISVDEKAAKMTAFLENHRVSFPVFLDTDQKLVAAVGIAAMPTSFLLDAEGKILSVHTGFKVESYEKELRREIAQHLPKIEGKQK